jgi:hypothetical protein
MRKTASLVRRELSRCCEHDSRESSWHLVLPTWLQTFLNVRRPRPRQRTKEHGWAFGARMSKTGPFGQVDKMPPLSLTSSSV